MKLEFSRRALREAEKGKTWWLSNREKAPNLFERELLTAIEQIKAAPDLGKVYGESKGRSIRYVLMPKTGHFVFYRQDTDGVIRVMSIWGARRVKGPALR